MIQGPRGPSRYLLRPIINLKLLLVVVKYLEHFSKSESFLFSRWGNSYLLSILNSGSLRGYNSFKLVPFKTIWIEGQYLSLQNCWNQVPLAYLACSSLSMLIKLENAHYLLRDIRVPSWIWQFKNYFMGFTWLVKSSWSKCRVLLMI